MGRKVSYSMFGCLFSIPGSNSFFLDPFFPFFIPGFIMGWDQDFEKNNSSDPGK